MMPPEAPGNWQELDLERRTKSAQRRHRLFVTGLISLVFVTCSVAAGLYAFQHGLQRKQANEPTTIGTPLTNRLNILLIGVDKRERDTGRTDTIMLVSIGPSGPSVDVISIPRDTRVRIPGRRGHDRVNAAYAYGGPELALQTVEELLGTSIEYYAEVDFTGFERLIDAIGGVDIKVEKRMRYHDRAQNLNIDLKPGLQHLNGEEALHYVRFRTDRLGDVTLIDPETDTYGGRVERQQRFLKAVTASVLRPGILLKIPELIKVTRQSLETNVPVDVMWKLAWVAARIRAESVQTAVLPGIAQTISRKSYWVADLDKTEALVRKMVYGSSHQPKVSVLNGSGEVGVANRVADQLEQRGFDIVYVGNADSFDHRRTEVRASEAHKSAAETLAQLLDASAVIQSDINHDQAAMAGGSGEVVADVTVVLGRDIEL